MSDFVNIIDRLFYRNFKTLVKVRGNLSLLSPTLVRREGQPLYRKGQESEKKNNYNNNLI